jgi:hypothetical protein
MKLFNLFEHAILMVFDRTVMGIGTILGGPCILWWIWKTVRKFEFFIWILKYITPFRLSKNCKFLVGFPSMISLTEGIESFHVIKDTPHYQNLIPLQENEHHKNGNLIHFASQKNLQKPNFSVNTSS